jgi:hypothetical protein
LYKNRYEAVVMREEKRRQGRREFYGMDELESESESEERKGAGKLKLEVPS